MENTKAKKISKKVVVLIICLAVVVVAAGVCGIIQYHKPYAITVDGKDVLLVKDKKTGEAVIEQLMNDYTAEDAKVKSLSLDKELDFDIIKLWEDYDKKDVMTKKAAIEYLKADNSDGDPLFVATIKGRTKAVEEYVPDVIYKKDDEMFAGDSRIEVEGVAGSQKVTYEITTENGEVTSKEAVKNKILDEGTAAVVYKGTIGLPDGEDWQTYEGLPVFKNGEDMSKYAQKWLGAPYKYGGHSLTTGIDCVAFVRQMYARYGINLPASHSGLQHSGKGISLSSAKAGDLVCYNGHVAIYIGGGKVVHATRGSGVKISNVHVKGHKLITVRRLTD